ncbi:MAG: hypothetical protein QMD00_05100 [Hadesarchaea archaeon]|nr:hypothetical protein [Hadesarchaea archaeon]
MKVKKVSAALRAVERWESYLFRRAVGATFIVCAILVAVAGFITLKAEPIASAIGMSSGALIGFTWLVAMVVIGVPIIVYLFTSAGRALERRKPAAARYRKEFMCVLLMWFAVMSIAGFLGPQYPVTWLVSIGVANVLTYAIVRKAGHTAYPEQLAVGTILLAASPFIFAMGTAETAYLSMLVVVLAYGAGGVYSLLAAPKALIESMKKLEPHITKARYPIRKGTELLPPVKFYSADTAKELFGEACKVMNSVGEWLTKCVAGK